MADDVSARVSGTVSTSRAITKSPSKSSYARAKCLTFDSKLFRVAAMDTPRSSVVRVPVGSKRGGPLGPDYPGSSGIVIRDPKGDRWKRLTGAAVLTRAAWDESDSRTAVGQRFSTTGSRRNRSFATPSATRPTPSEMSATRCLVRGLTIQIAQGALRAP